MTEKRETKWEKETVGVRSKSYRRNVNIVRKKWRKRYRKSKKEKKSVWKNSNIL